MLEKKFFLISEKIKISNFQSPESRKIKIYTTSLKIKLKISNFSKDNFF